MDYEALWVRLREEMLYLITQEVKAIDPHIVLSFMQFMQQIEEQKSEQSSKS